MKLHVIQKLFRPVMAAVLMLGVILAPAGTASAESDVINVPADYATIQAAVDAASPGDRIIVSAGNYQENVIIDKPVELFGTGQAGTSIPTTYITALNPAQPVFILNADDIIIRWMEIKDADTSDGIYANGTSGHVIIENRFRSNMRGIRISGTPERIQIGLNTFEYNTDALIIESGTGITVSGNTFTNNTVHDIHLTETSSFFSYTIYNNTFTQGDKCFDDAITGNPAEGTVYWYDTQNVLGNYWGNYTSADTYQPYGIGDTPCPVIDSSGITVNQDQYPLLYPPKQGAWVRIEAPDTVIQGESFTARLVVENVNELSSVECIVTFDPDVLDFESISAGQLDGRGFSAGGNLINPGEYKVLQYLLSSTISGSGYLCEITFRAIGDPASLCLLDFDNMMMSSASGSSPVIPGIWTGHEFSIVGDANGDGSVNVLDITAIARIILGYEDPTDGADANGDGKVNVSDIAKTARIILGLE